MAPHRRRNLGTDATAFAAALALLCSVTSAEAQGLDAEPIFLDIRPASNAVDGAAVAPILVAAFEPNDAAPLFLQSDQPEGVQLAALDLSPDLPRPSIIVGRIEPGDEARFGITSLLPETLAGFAFAYDDLEARAALRESDPELFASLVEGGHIDPPPDLLVRAIQTEMSRMNCYRSGIDGQWGRGSRGSVGEYYGKLENVTWPDTDATNELFRSILINGDVTCDTPQVTRAPARSNTGNTARSTTRSTPTRSAPARSAPARTQQPAPSAPAAPRIVVR